MYESMAETVERYRDQHYSALTAEQRAALDTALQRLYDTHDRFTAIAIRNTLDALGDQLREITTITSRAAESLKHLKTAERIIKIVAAAAELAEAITAANYGAIPDAIATAASALHPANGEPGH